MQWTDLSYFLALVRAGSFAAAARRLRVDETTVARRLKALERALGARLIERIDGKLRLTAAGNAALARTERAEAEIDGLSAEVAGSDRTVSGTVRLTAVPIVVSHILIPQLPSLLRAHPLLRVEIAAESRNLSLSRREADIAIRLARPAGDRARTRRIGTLDYAVYARRGARGDLPWIGYSEEMAHLAPARWIRAQPGATAPLAVNDAAGLLAGLRAGLGRSLLPVRIGAAQPELRRLGREAALSREVWLLVHPELRGLARIDAAIGWLDRIFSARRPA